jgi:predicted kinase
MKTVYLLIGPSNTGKSTWAMKKIEELGGKSSYFNADSIRKELYGDASIQGNGKEVFSLLKARYGKALADPKVTSIFIDNTSITHRDRKQYFDGKSTFVLVYFDVPIETALLRNSLRERKVPEEVIRRQYGKLQPPTVEERAVYEVQEVRE